MNLIESFAGLMLFYAAGSPIDMTNCALKLEQPLKSVREHLQTAAPGSAS